MQSRLLEPKGGTRDTVQAYVMIGPLEDCRSSVVEGRIWSIFEEVMTIRDNRIWCIARSEIEDDGAK